MTLQSIQVAIVGESQVGKSAMCMQLVSDGTNFPKNYLMTQAMEIFVKSINIPDTNDVVELYLADCSGREIYSDFVSECLKDASMFVVVYDVSREDTFKSVAKVKNAVTPFGRLDHTQKVKLNFVI